jgi:hypothetical protein
MSGTALSTLFSFANFFVFALILAYYNLTILLVFLEGTHGELTAKKGAYYTLVKNQLELGS